MNIDNNQNEHLMDLNNHYALATSSTGLSNNNIKASPSSSSSSIASNNVNSPQPNVNQQMYSNNNNNPYFSKTTNYDYATNNVINDHLDDHIGNLDSCINELTNVSHYGMSTHSQEQQLLETPTKKTPIKSDKNLNGNNKKPKLNKSSTKLDNSPQISSITANKRRKKDPKAPKAPLNGYLVYFNEERVAMRQANPNMSFGELTKIIAIKWKELQPNEKQKYITEAELDKERYVKEMEEYKQSDAYKNYIKEANASKLAKANEKSNLQHQQQQPPAVIMNGLQQQQSQYNIQHQQQWQQHDMSNSATSSTLATSSSMSQQQYYYPQQQQQQQQMYQQQQMNVQQPRYDIPIFTDNFVEHNKTREQEVRQLRKEISELEQQNSVLNKHIDNMKQSIMKIEKETTI